MRDHNTFLTSLGTTFNSGQQNSQEQYQNRYLTVNGAWTNAISNPVCEPEKIKVNKKLLLV